MSAPLAPARLAQIAEWSALLRNTSLHGGRGEHFDVKTEGSRDDVDTWQHVVVTELFGHTVCIVPYDGDIGAPDKGTADAIAGAGMAIFDLLAALAAMTAERDALRAELDAERDAQRVRPASNPRPPVPAHLRLTQEETAALAAVSDAGGEVNIARVRQYLAILQDLDERGAVVYTRGGLVRITPTGTDALAAHRAK